MSADAVTDLSIVAATESAVGLEWTEVSDGSGRPANYRVKYAESPIDWQAATIGCDRTIHGTEVGATMACTVEGLAPGTTYDFQLMSYRGSWNGAVYSNVATGQTTSPTSSDPDAEAVTDLAVGATSDSSMTVSWTEVDDGRGAPASYRVKYSAPAIDYATATVACDVTGTEIGVEASCAITGLTTGSTYDVQLMSFRWVNGTWEGATYSNVATGEAARPVADDPATQDPTAVDADAVTDLSVTGTTESTLNIRWTQVDDGTGQPALYRVKYSAPAIDYATASVGCDVTGTQIGAEASCTIEGLAEASTYDVQLMSYRLVNGGWEGATYSNVATGQTATGSTDQTDPGTDPSTGSGIWLSAAEIAALPMSGSAWNNVKSAADQSCGVPDISNQDDDANVCVLAKALVYARTGQLSYRVDVLAAIQAIATSGTYVGRALAMGRELGTYVIAADLVGLPTVDPTLDDLFRSKLRELRTTYTSGAADNLILCHEERPNNWGAHCGATRAAIAVYLNDTADLQRTAQVFKGYLGDRSSYAGFSYGGPDDDLTWQCDPTRPVGINPAGCTRDGRPLGGVLPDDQRRGGSYSWPPPQENYVWEALQGLLVQATILYRAGYPVWDWEDRALLRAVEWLHDAIDFTAEGDDQWQPHLVNHFYGTSFPATTPARSGKNMGWTDWTHR